MTNPIYNAQHLLYRWISHYEERSYQSIKEACDYLNSSMNLGLYGNTMWALFYPLMRLGIVDCVGNDYYAVTNTIALDCDTHLYVVNGGNEYDYPYVGYKMIDSKDAMPSYCNIVKLSTLAILKSFPTIRDVVYNWDNSIQDESILKYHNNSRRAGIAELETGMIRYFVIPSECILKEIPSRRINPDAYNIGITYERVINHEQNGVYDMSSHELKMHLFGIPILLYRALMIDGLYKQQFPKEEDGYVVFYNISKAIAKELNRILCNSISYE